MVRRALISLLLLCALAACAPTVDGPWQIDRGPPSGAHLTPKTFITKDGMALPLQSWPARRDPLQGVILALHGFNDSANTFAEAGPWWASLGYAVYAYDQRGFGGSPSRGRWSGGPAMAQDLYTMSQLLRQKHPDVPLIVVGESMGGAVILVTADLLTKEPSSPPWVDGAVVAAPAVWGRDFMPWTHRVAMAVMVRLAPSLTLSGKGLGIQPTDNIEMLRGLSRDPKIIRETRVSSVYGLTNLMDQAQQAATAGRIQMPLLWLYGAHDQLIPPEPTYRAAKALLDPQQDQRLVLYENGWHMLIRDLQSEAVFADIAAFAQNPKAALPFGKSVPLTADGFADAHRKMADSQ